MNHQPREKRTDGTDNIVVHSMFPTVQGEGPFTGQPALFVRLAGCNLRCPLCDTDYTSKRSVYEVTSLVQTIVNARKGFAGDLIVITGGEPMRQPIGPLCFALAHAGYRVQIETNGTIWREEFARRHRNIYIVCSPKASRVAPLLWPQVDAVKYVLHADSVDADGLPLRALDHPNAGRVARPPADWHGKKSDIYLQPVDVGDAAENARHARRVVLECLTHGYTVCVQTHKVLGVE